MEPAPVGRGDDDVQLLQRYAREQDESAFALLVRRYVNLVYSAARRRVDDPHMAEDVSQAVFVVLARKARSIHVDTPLCAWLLRTVRYAAANALKIESRRRRREAALAAACNASSTRADNPSDALVWREVRSGVDDAVLKLSAPDRLVILLRYFEDRPIADVAARLNVTEGAVKQRLNRAIDKLRARLKRHAPELTSVESECFAGLLASNALSVAPPGLADAACSIATARAAHGASITIAKGAMNMMTWTKLKLGTAIAASVILGSAGAIVSLGPSRGGPQVMASLASATTGANRNAEPGDKNGGITGVEDAPPVVVATFPQAGAADVDSNTTEIKITFSKEMQDGNWAFVQIDKEAYPKTTGDPHFEDDARTCVLPVKLEPAHTYVIWLNKAPYTSFMDPEGRRAVPYLLVFQTRQ